MKIAASWFAGLICLCVGISVCRAENVFRDPERTFVFTVPEAFLPVPEGAESPDFVCVYYIPVEDEATIPITLGIERLGGVIGREHLDEEDLSQVKGELAVAQVSLSRALWKDFEIDVLTTVISTPEGNIVSHAAQVPIRREAIQLIVSGPETRREDTRGYLEQALRGLDGESNWTPSLRSSSAANEKVYVAVLLAIAGAIVLGGLVGLWLLSRVTPKGVVLAVAVVVWIMGAGIGRSDVRELVGIGGALQLLGFAGGILGIVDLFRKS